MNGSRSSEAREHEFAEVMAPGDPSPEHLDITDLASVRLNISAELGEAGLTVREVLELKEGAVVPLDKLAGEMTDIYVNGVLLAHGEVVVIADSLHVRVADICGVVEEERET
jgi:flagellar motor switch protein FliN